MSEKRTFVVEAVEKFLVVTTYTVQAKDAEEAESLCKSGDVAYDEKEILEGDEEWVETVFVKVAE